MIRRVGVFVAWFAVTVVAIGIASAAVGSVRGQVTDVPVIPTAGTAALLATSTTTAPITESSTSTTATTEPSTTTTSSTPDATTTTTSTTIPSTTTTSTIASATTTTAIAPPKKYDLVGGQVTILAVYPTVTLVAAVPAGGFSAEIENGGPEEVRVEFESEQHKSSFRAEWEDGELDVDIDEESEGDDD